jgi:predicted nucleic acid-binding protein
VARKDYVLDTSALFALIEEEDGAERVEEIMRSENAILPWLVLFEVHYITRQERGPGEADRRYAFLKQSPCEVVWQVDESTLLVASRFKASHHLSFADAVIAAIAFRREAVLVHKDPEYDVLADNVKLEALPYKPKGKPPA